MNAEFGIIYCPFGYDTGRKPWSIIRFEETPSVIKMNTVGEYLNREDAVQAAQELHLNLT